MLIAFVGKKNVLLLMRFGHYETVSSAALVVEDHFDNDTADVEEKYDFRFGVRN